MAHILYPRAMRAPYTDDNQTYRFVSAAVYGALMAFKYLLKNTAIALIAYQIAFLLCVVQADGGD